MLAQLHMAKSSTFAFQRKMQMVADNIANSTTVGFKGHNMQMESLFPNVFERVVSEFEDPNVPIGKKRRRYVEFGSGIRIAEITKDMRQGTIEITNRPLDLAIQGKGFFQFRMPDGSLSYGRAGNLHQDFEGNLMDPNGHPLEPPVRVPRNTSEIIIDESGRIFAQVNNEAIPREVGQLILANFQNEQGLKGIGQNLYIQTSASGEPIFQEPGSEAAGVIRQRALEFSNVSVIDELVKMLLTQRSFEVNIKSIKIADDMIKSSTEIPR